MSIISAVMGAVAASGGGGGGGGATNGATWNSIQYSTVQEGQQNYFTVDFTDWDGSSTFYYSITDPSNFLLTSQFDTVESSYVPAAGSSSHTFYFTANADSTTEGAMYYWIRGGSTYFGYQYFNMGSYTIRDSSQTHSVVLDVDPASLGTMYGLTSWTDASGKGNNLSINNGTTSTDNGGTLIFNSTTTYAVDNGGNLTNAAFGSVTVSAWIKPDVVNRTQTIISKELCYKLNITSDGRIVWMVGSANDSSWSVTMYSGYDLITTSTWHHVLATVDADNTRIFIDGELASISSGVILVANGQPFNIGSYAGGQGDFFGGVMGQVKMWNYALTGTNVVSYYNSFASRYGLSPVSLRVTSVTPYPSSGNEGDVIDIQPIWHNNNGETVYWTVKYGTDVGPSNFVATTGTFVVSGSSSNFYVSTIEDLTTQGHDWTFGIKLGTTVGGNDLWDGIDTLVTIHDTSRTPLPSFILTAPPTNTSTWVGTGITATIYTLAGTYTTTSTYGGGIVWNDTNYGYIEIPGTTSTANLTLSFAADFQPADGHWNSIYAGGGYSTDNIFAYLPSGDSRYIVAGTGNDVKQNVIAINNTGTAWWDFVYTATSITVYQNAAPVLTGTLSSPHTGSTMPLWIGVRYGNSGDWLGGTIYQVKYQPAALNPAQVLSQYQSQTSTYELSAINELPEFDFYNPPPSPADWPDATTSSVIANIVGSYTYDPDHGGGVIFNGDPDQYIEIQGVNYVTQSFTISMAAKLTLSGSHYSPVFDGSSQDRLGQDIWANFWGYPGLSVGIQGEIFSGDPGTVDGATVAWWDFVYSGDSVKAYKNGVEIISGTLPQPNTGWHSNLRIGNEYNQTGNVMAGTFYRIKYVKSALTQSEIIDQYNNIAFNYDLLPIPLSLVFDNTSSYLIINPEYIVTGYDEVASFGTISQLNVVKGTYPQPRAGWIINSTATSNHSTFTATVTTVVDHSTYWALNFEPQSPAYTFGLDGPHTLHPTQPWALGTSWTIEFWIKANDKSTTAQGGIWGLLNQGGWNTVNSINIALSDDKLVVGQGAMNTDVRYTEPTVGVWTHVAIVNNSGSQTVFYNGAKQTKVEGSYDTANYTNNTDPLYIGRLAPIFGGFFNGEMANVRILNRPLYSPPIVQTDVNVGSNANYLGIFETLDYSQDLTGYIVNGPGVYNAKVSSFYSPDYAVSIEGQLFQAGETYTFTSPPFNPLISLYNGFEVTTGTMLLLNSEAPLIDQSDYNYSGANIHSTMVSDPLTYLDFLTGTYGQFAAGVRQGDYIFDAHDPSNISTVAGPVVDNGASVTVSVLTSWFTSTTAGGTDAVSIYRDANFVTNTNVIKTLDAPTTSTVALGSLYFDRTSNGYLTLNSPVVFGESDFTIEFWINLKSLVGFNTILSCPTTNVQDGTAIYLNSSLLVIDSSPATGGGDTQWDLSGYISTSTWHHIAISRQGAGIGAWINGKGMGDLSARTNYGSATGYPAIGKLWYGDAPSAMQLTNLRVIGIAVYDPAHEFINVPTDVLNNNSCNLLLLANSSGNAYDDSTGNYSVTNHNGVVWIAGPVKHY